jgi:hypothetical protein
MWVVENLRRPYFYKDSRASRRISFAKFQTPPMSEEPSNFSMDPNGDTSADADPQLPWPRSGDQLFGPDEDWDNNACINFTFDRFNLYARGYLQAAELLVETIVNTHRSPHAVVYPIAFLYRHYLELRLKKIILWQRRRHVRDRAGNRQLEYR